MPTFAVVPARIYFICYDSKFGPYTYVYANNPENTVIADKCPGRFLNLLKITFIKIKFNNARSKFEKYSADSSLGKLGVQEWKKEFIIVNLS